MGILAGGAATRSAIDANSMRFLYGGRIEDDEDEPGGGVVPAPPPINGAVPGMAGDERDISTGGVCGAFRERSAAAEPSGELAASGTTLETARSTAEKLYLELPPPPPPLPADPVPPVVPSDGLSRLADLVGVEREPGEAMIEGPAGVTPDAPVADEGCTGGGVSILPVEEDVVEEEEDDFGGFISIELNASWCSLSSEADGARYMLFASSVAFERGSGISYLSCADANSDDMSGSLVAAAAAAAAEKFGNIER